MKIAKLLKILFIALGGIISIIIITAIILVTLVNPNNYKTIIINSVKSNTDRDLNINGDISWNFFPNIGLHISNVSLSNPQNFLKTSANFMELKSIDVTMQLMPLLHKNIIIDHVIINGLDLTLINSEYSKTNNWTFENNAIDPNKADTKKMESSSPIVLNLSKFILHNANIKYINLIGKVEEGKVGDSKQLKSFDLNLSVKNGGLINYDQKQKIINFNKVVVNFNDMLKGDLNFKMDNFNNYTGNININQLLLNNLLVKLDYLKSNTVRSDAVNSDTTKSDVTKSEAGDTTINRNLLNNLALQMDFNGNKNSFNAPNIKWKINDTLKGNLRFTVTNLVNLQYLGNINIGQFSLNELLVKMGHEKPKIPNQNLLNKVAFQTEFSGNKNSFNATNIKLRVSDSLINGQINATSIKPLIIKNQLSLNKIELSDVINTQGYKVPMQDFNISGNLSNNLSHNSKNNAKQDFISQSNINQNISVQNITLMGFDLDELIHNLDQMITNAINIPQGNTLEQIGNSINIINLIKNMQNILEQAKKSGNKNLNKTTNLGRFTSNINVVKGISATSAFALNGASTKIMGKGSINFNNKSMNYNVMSQITVKQKNKLLNEIIFPYNLHGNFSNLDGSLDWESIQKQVVNYYFVNHGKEIIKKTIHDTINNQLKNNSGDIQKGVNSLIKGIFH